ncbi:hypothetical protein [Halodesulfovibrio spirochaetisodalis]|uniref:hypothetical protein n=1 Tax=Halodesulfovibrio spirochaetisodalis TaxID=1560234 RepID=UPI001E3E56E7|nr:hypothetical protein [Halodesulfovibrio spirochaetisodalis]
MIEKTGRSVGYNKSVPEYVLIGVRGREEETLVPKSNQAQNRDMYQTQKVTMSKSGHSPKSTPHQSQKWDGHQYQKWDTESPIEPPNESPSIYCPEFEEQSTPLIQQTLICTLPLNDGSAFEVTQEFVAELAPLYPNVDVSQALRAMKGWLIGNQTRRKTRRGIKAFITSWLSREQDKPRAAAVPQHGQVPQPRSYRECVDLEQRQEVEYLNQLREELNATGTNGADSLGAGQAQPALASGESVSRNRA